MGRIFSRESRKAGLAAAIALVGSLAAGSLDGSLVLAEYLAATSAALVDLRGVHGIKNADGKYNLRMTTPTPYVVTQDDVEALISDMDNFARPANASWFDVAHRVLQGLHSRGIVNYSM